MGDGGLEILVGQNSSFQEDSTYLKNMANSNYQSNKNGGIDVSFDSSSNHGGFSQAGTPMSYKVKMTQPQANLKSGVKNIMTSSTVSGAKLGANSAILNPASSIERKPGKKLVLPNHQPYTTGVVTINNSIVPSPSSAL